MSGSWVYFAHMHEPHSLFIGAATDLVTNEAVDADTLDAQEHGGLVRKILETKKV